MGDSGRVVPSFSGGPLAFFGLGFVGGAWNLLGLGLLLRKDLGFTGGGIGFTESLFLA